MLFRSGRLRRLCLGTEIAVHVREFRKCELHIEQPQVPLPTIHPRTDSSNNDAALFWVG